MNDQVSALTNTTIEGSEKIENVKRENVQEINENREMISNEETYTNK